MNKYGSLECPLKLIRFLFKRIILEACQLSAQDSESARGEGFHIQLVILDISHLNSDEETQTYYSMSRSR